MSLADSERADRARARASWPGELVRLCDPIVSTPPEAAATAVGRIANCWALSVDAYLLSGRPWPAYERADMPGRILRGDAK